LRATSEARSQLQEAAPGPARRAGRGLLETGRAGAAASYTLALALFHPPRCEGPRRRALAGSLRQHLAERADRGQEEISSAGGDHPLRPGRQLGLLEAVAEEQAAPLPACAGLPVLADEDVVPSRRLRAGGVSHPPREQEFELRLDRRLDAQEQEAPVALFRVLSRGGGVRQRFPEGNPRAQEAAGV